MTYIESKIYGSILVLVSLGLLALTISHYPFPESTGCLPKPTFRVIGPTNTFKIGEHIAIENTTKGYHKTNWLISDTDSILVGHLNSQSMILQYQTEGKRTIQLRLGDDADCTTSKRSINIVANCEDGIKNGSETAIDCGGKSCSPCPEKPITQALKPKKRKGIPKAYIIRVTGDLKCNEVITFDCGIFGDYNLSWSFDDAGTRSASTREVQHKFRNAGTYTIKVYIDNKVVGSKKFTIESC